MTSYVTPKKNAAFVTYVSLEDQANAGLFKASPTLAAGDFKVSIDGGALANLATLPTNTPASSTMVKISLSADEMNGDNITVVCKDAAGAEWYDLVLNIQTSARQVDDLAYPATSGRSLTVAATGEASANVTMQAGVAVAAADGNGNVPVVLYGTQPAVTFGQVKILANVNNEGALHIVNSASGNGIGQYSYGDESGQTNDGVYSALRNVASYGVAQYNYSPGGNVSGVDPSGIRAALGMSAANLDAQLDAIGGLTAQDVADALLLAPSGVAAAGSAMDYLADIVEDTGTTLPGTLATLPADIDTELTSSHGAGSWAGGGGAGSGTGVYTDTLESPSGTPVDGARVTLTTDDDGENVAYEARTDAFGVFEMRPDPGTYYRFIEAAGHTFVQGVEVEVTEP